jgi:hypothetical protein
MANPPRYFGRPVLGATRARQGRLGRDVFWVLLISTALAAVALFAAWTWKSGDLASTQPTRPAQARDASTYQMGTPAAQEKAPLPVG